MSYCLKVPAMPFWMPWRKLFVFSCLFCLGLFSVFSVQAQSGPALPGIAGGEVAWADYDGDNYPDLLLCGEDSTGAGTIALLHNDSAGSFSPVNAGLLQLSHSFGAWGDYDGDGDPDLVISGRSGRQKAQARIYRNDSSLGFTALSVSIKGLESGSAHWVDLDGDSDLDLFMTGFNPFDFNSVLLYRNDGSGTFTQVGLPNVAGVSQSRATFGDVDKDGDQDLVLCGVDGLNEAFTGYYRNDGGLQFSPDTLGLPLPMLESGNVHLADYDQDGDPDLIANGFDPALYRTVIFRNLNNEFQAQPYGIPGLALGVSQWIDFDLDGDQDYILMGVGASGPFARVYRQDMNLQFSNTNSPINGMYYARVAWADFDQDQDLDFAVMGFDAQGLPVAEICVNLNGQFQP